MKSKLKTSSTPLALGIFGLLLGVIAIFTKWATQIKQRRILTGAQQEILKIVQLRLAIGVLLFLGGLAAVNGSAQAQQACVPLPAGAIAWWSFDDTSSA